MTPPLGPPTVRAWRAIGMTPETVAFEISPLAFWTIMAGGVIVLGLALEQLYTFFGLVERARELGSAVG